MRFEMRCSKASKRAWKKAAKAEGLSLAAWMTAAANLATLRSAGIVNIQVSN